MSKIKVGIAGFGLSGRVFHYPLISANASYEITTVQSSRVDEVKAVLPNAHVVQTIDELCSSPVDLVIVGVPNFLHLKYASKALAAGKHVVVEKPFTVTSADASKLIELSTKAGRILTVFHNRRWDADFQTIAAIQKSGALGEIVYYEAHFDRFKPDVDNRWKEQSHPGSGILFDLGSHLIDQALQLFGEPQRVFADIASLRPQASQDDYFHVILDFGRTRAVLHASALVASPGPRFIVHGTRGSFVKSGMDPQENQLKQGVQATAPEFGLESADAFGVLVNSVGERKTSRRIPSEPGCYVKFYDQLALAIQGTASVPVEPRDAAKVIRIIELARASSWGRIPLSLFDVEQ